VDQAAGTANRTIDKVAGSIGANKEKLHSTVNTVADKAQQALGQVTDMAGQYGPQLRQASQQAMDTAQRLQAQATNFIQEKPLVAVATIFAAGFILGKLRGRRYIIED
jgi:ElaB/YqjD/DUF883 family membrane-anchored ribosome-binding protein